MVLSEEQKERYLVTLGKLVKKYRKNADANPKRREDNLDIWEDLSEIKYLISKVETIKSEFEIL